MRGLVLFMATAVTAALMLPIGASARGTYTCDGSIGIGPGVPPTFVPSTIDANVDVPAGATCHMDLVTVTGNVTVEGTLIGFANTFQRNISVDGGAIAFPFCLGFLCPKGGTTVEGNLTASNANGVTLDTTNFGRNVTLDGATGRVEFSFSIVSGNLSISNSSGMIILFDMSGPGVPGVGKNLDLSSNSGGAGLVEVTIAGNLNCDSNAPAPTLTNVTAARENGQCSAA